MRTQVETRRHCIRRPTKTGMLKKAAGGGAAAAAAAAEEEGDERPPEEVVSRTCSLAPSVASQDTLPLGLKLENRLLASDN